MWFEHEWCRRLKYKNPLQPDAVIKIRCFWSDRCFDISTSSIFEMLHYAYQGEYDIDVCSSQHRIIRIHLVIYGKVKNIKAYHLSII